MRKCKGIVKRFLGGTALCLMASSILNPANFEVRAANAASLKKIGEGDVTWTETTGTDGRVSYQLTATPAAGYRLKEIKLNGTTIAGTQAAGGTYTFKDADKVAQKVYFGKNGSNAQEWWIAGYDSTTQGLVLLCDPNTPMNDEQVFLAEDKYEQGDGENDSDNYYNKTAYTADWGCVYSGYAPTGKVYANHYGGSDIRAVLKDYETDTSKFSTAEQNLMKETAVRTWDHKNDKFYRTTSKLYLGSCDVTPLSSLYTKELPDQEDLLQMLYMTVGANDNLKVALTSKETLGEAAQMGYNSLPYNGPEKSPYISGDKWFWLRSPYAGNSYTALDARTGNVVDYWHVYSSYRCVPAFALNLSSVIFASAAAPAASSSSALSDGWYSRFGVYLRVADPAETPKISTSATTSGTTLEVKKGSESGNIYLYIQGNDGTDDWVYSKQLTQNETIEANNSIHTGLTSFTNCRVWLETTDDNVTYAKEVETAAPTEMKSFIGVESLNTESTKYGLFTDSEQVITVEFEEKADISPTVSIAGWSYKEQANSPSVSGNNGGGAVTYEYKVKGAEDSEYSTTVPTAVGDYTVRATIAETDGYNGGTATANFEIKHAVYIKRDQLPKVLSGVGGKAGYRYNLNTGKLEFYCKPEPGYKLEGIIMETDGTKYVKFKIV